MHAITVTPKPLTKACWIWPEGHVWDIHNCYALFRKEFDLVTIPKKAPLFITADQSYRLWINGAYICRGPARGFQSHWPYDEVNVAAYLRKGRNIFAVRAYNPGMSNFQYICQGYAGLLAGAKWGKVELVTDKSWRCVRDPAVIRDTVPTSKQLFPQEWYDARKKIVDWKMADFDDSAWEKARTQLWNAPPWYAIEPRRIPMLAEKEMIPFAVVGEAFGNCAPDYLVTRNVAQLRGAEEKAHEPSKNGRIPLVVQKTGKGYFRSYVLDFGRIVVGNLSLKVSGCQGEEIVDTLHVETINEKKCAPDIFYPGGSHASFGYRLICRRGETQHTFHHYYGFRYLVITVRDSKSELTVAPKLHWVGYPLERKGGLITSEYDIAKIWEACAWTQQCCMTDAYIVSVAEGQKKLKDRLLVASLILFWMNKC
ncbi:MAG: family 78 glycoside hydrolase catalytic domain [Planctomycetota bacterium]